MILEITRMEHRGADRTRGARGGSLILGVVGAGGIGFYIQTYVRSFQYDKAVSVTLAVIILVVAIEAINVALRRRFT